MTRRLVISIDPGEVHCGTAVWLESECIEVREYQPLDLYKWLTKRMDLNTIKTIVMEEYRLYPWKSVEQGFSQLKTVETIGIIRYITTVLYGVKLVEQPALIKKPAAGHMRAAGIENRAVVEKKGGHCADAFLHGWYYLNKPQNKGESNAR